MEVNSRSLSLICCPFSFVLSVCHVRHKFNTRVQNGLVKLVNIQGIPAVVVKKIG